MNLTDKGYIKLTYTRQCTQFNLYGKTRMTNANVENFQDKAIERHKTLRD